MQDGPLDKFVLGVFLTLAGLLIIILHKSVKEWRDSWVSRDWPFGYGEMWTGKYTRGGLIFTYAVIILAGIVLIGAGISLIVGSLR